MRRGMLNTYSTYDQTKKINLQVAQILQSLMQLRQTSVTSHTKLTQVKPKVNMLSIKQGRRVTGTMLQFNMYATKMIENVIL